MKTLHVQNYLRGGKTLSDLTTELGIVVKEHETLPIVILNYSQIDSPKTHPIVRECRALVLEKDTWDVVAKAFDRFFNWGEVADEMPLFNWNDFKTTTKEDGSLVPVYFYAGQWRINTRGSFADTLCGESGKTWDELIRPLLNENKIADKDNRYTFVFEFCSEFNKVVRYYKQPVLKLLTVVDNQTLLELTDEEKECYKDIWEFVEEHHFDNVDDVWKYVEKLEDEDPTNEGVVVCDNENRRWKFKNKKYLSLHHMYMNGEVTNKRLLPFALSGERDELLAYFPELKEKLDNVVNVVNVEFEKLVKVWEENKDIEEQKEFACAIVPKTRFNSILFKVRKEKGEEQELQDIKQEWRNAEQLIVKVLGW